MATDSELEPDVRALLAPLYEGELRGAVAFDADGTLWSGDVGEDLLRALDGGLPRYPGRTDVYAEYERRVAVDPRDGFAFAVCAMEGMGEEGVEHASHHLLSDGIRRRIFPFARQLVADLHRLGNDVWVVSASPVWSVWPGTDALDIPRKRVIGARALVRDGLLTGRVDEPLPTLEGKPQRLEAAGVRALVAVGNSLLDVPLLRAAERAFVVAPEGNDSEITRLARTETWPLQWV